MRGVYWRAVFITSNAIQVEAFIGGRWPLEGAVYCTKYGIRNYNTGVDEYRIALKFRGST